RHERDVFLDHPHAADGKDDRERKQRIPGFARRLQEVGELIATIALEFEMKRFVRLERRVDEKPQRAAGLEDGAMPGVLWQQRPLALASWSEADARSPRVRV